VNRLARRLALLAAAAGALYALRVASWRPFAVHGDAPEDGLSRASGVIHVHTTLSDGGGTPQEVIAEARAADLDFVAITDHNHLEAKPLEGYHDGLLVLVGTEISTPAGHLLGLGLRRPGYRFAGDALDALTDVRDLGGFAFAAHPVSPHPDFRFGGWELPGPWGLELLNGDSQWREAGLLRLLTTSALYPLNRSYALLSALSAPDAALARWDELLARRDVAGVVGADAHSRLPVGKRRALRFPSYASLFGLVRNHVLLEAPLSGDAAADARAVAQALARGRAYVGLDALAPAGAFGFVAEAGELRFTMGDTAPPLPGLRLRAGGRVPRGTVLSLVRDGRRLLQSDTSLDVEAPGPGVYRVEARVPGWRVPWILTNPIYVFDAATAAERARRGAWPDPVPAPAPDAVLDRFENGSRFHPEFDEASSVAFDFDAQGPAEGRASGRMVFRLGEPGEGRPHVWCALMDREAQDLAGRRGLVFWVRGDAEHRVLVQVRDRNPASADEGTEWWFASVRTSTEWRRVAVPFARMRSLNPKSDGRLDLAEVRGIGFVFDVGSARPGDGGTLWLDELGVY
jgi:hypothetical protein